MYENVDPAWNDSATDLWRKLARVFYGLAVAQGFSYNLEPNALDTKIQSMRKVCSYTAYLALNP